jgi:hypothetical protein
MKTFFTLLAGFLIISSSAIAQGIDKLEPQQFWDTNILALIDGDVEKVVSQSNFPITTFDGDWSEEAFIDAFEILFDRTALAELKTQSFRDIQPFEESGGKMTYMVVITTLTESDGEVYESSTLLSFKKFGGEWKLFDIDMAG